MNSTTGERKALLLLLTTAVLWSFSGVLIKSVDWNPLAIAAVRSLLAWPFLWIAVRLAGPFRWKVDHFIGGIAYSAAIISFVAATKMTTAANAIVLQYTAPIYVGLLSASVLKEPLHPRDWGAVALALAGVVLFFFDRMTLSGLWGNMLALFSGLSFGVMTVLMRRQKESHPIGTALVGNLIAGLGCFPFALRSDPPAAAWIPLAVLGIVQLGLAYLLFAAALKRVTAIHAITIPIIEPVLNPLWVFLFIGERPGHWALPGAFLVVAAVILRTTATIPAPTAAQTPPPPNV